jgi:hypothetical protein
MNSSKYQITVIINNMTSRLPSDVRTLCLFSGDTCEGEENELGGSCSTNGGEEERI